MIELEILQTKYTSLLRKLEASDKNVDTCGKKYAQAKVHYNEETKDLEKIEEPSFAHFVRSVIGSQDKRMEKEKQEQIQARYQLDQAAEELEEEKANYAKLELQVAQAKQALEELKEQLAASNPEYQMLLNEESAKRMEWRQQLIEVEEAFRAGESILDRIEFAHEHLRSAQNWSTMDMMGGGFFTDMMKYDKIDKAEELMAKVDSELRRYQIELKDVEYEWESNFEFISNGHRTMDVFFDNIFSDISNNTKIKNNIAGLITLQDQIIVVQNRLKKMDKELRKQIELSEQLYQ
ncbi:hypothetical protein [Marinilactibacillus piezotolerans]|uniref:hypothetical protein n=1 Tax=Marinilactibacillus piezotolerans TaxID=258723 RepID=UPI0009B1454A|nr:hypothetical protein [Marinilactibacillus piezotolerans]